MSDGEVILGLYEPAPSEHLVDSTINAFEIAGFDVTEVEETVSEGYVTFEVPYENWTILVDIKMDGTTGPDEPAVHMGLGEKIYPSVWNDAAAYHRAMSVLFELVCRLATKLDAAYTPVFDSEGRSMSVVPRDRPIGDAVESPPILGVYSDDVLAQFGGLNAMFDSPPWYTAELSGGKTVVVESEEPWGGWRPPTDAEFIESASFHHGRDTSESGRHGLSDPFAAFDVGDIGADVCVPRDDISQAFPNEDIELIHVRVDENRDLRRIGSDRFVRNIVDEDPGNDMTFIKAMLADIPADATEHDPMVSALLDGRIPPSFVRLDDADAQNVVTRVMDLGTTVSKFELLLSLGRVTQQDDFTAEDLESMEGTLDTLNELDDENVDQYIEQKLL
ncbi:hypothetical protein NDI56_16655 [Haloarcula sp. S1CR25-12]|uniref:Uncharacterized protein n=1 Tax=Haloarcula saliterrae TaxID=2950534 RepID=A0ABU2FFI8_9EURY|nr:hypothetical protein [Haloarcula sp. S1CR25-12]MDS0261032.1 hypothetical protein [Haloarcula sp. S1CR25-12]